MAQTIEMKFAQIEKALAEGRRVFAKNITDGGYDQITSVEDFTKDDTYGLGTDAEAAVRDLRIEKPVVTKYIPVNIKRTAGESDLFVTLDHNGFQTMNIGSCKHFPSLRMAKADARKNGLKYVLPVSYPLSYNEETGEVSYNMEVGKKVKVG